METALKQLIKEAVLEALVEFANGGVSTLSVGDENPPLQTPQVDDPKDSEVGGTTGNGEDESGKGGASEESSGGGTFGDGRPKPDVGIGVFGRR